MPEKDAAKPARDPSADAAEPATDSKRARASPAGTHFLSPKQRQVLRQGPTFVQKTPRQYDSRRIDRERRDYASQYARAKRTALADGKAALEDLAFLAETMDADWLHDLASHLVPPRDVPAEIARAFAIPEVLPRLLEALAAKVGDLRGLEIEPMTDPNPRDWPADYKQTGTVRLERKGAQLVTVWLAAVEAGLNVAERGRQVHAVSHAIHAPPAPPRASAGALERQPKRKRRRTRATGESN